MLFNSIYLAKIIIKITFYKKIWNRVIPILLRLYEPPMAPLTLQRRSESSIMLAKLTMIFELKTKSSAIHWKESWRNWRLLSKSSVKQKHKQSRNITIYKSLITKRSLKLFMVLKTLQQKPERSMRLEWEISLLVMTSGQTLKRECLRPSKLHTEDSLVKFLTLAKSMSPFI